MSAHPLDIYENVLKSLNAVKSDEIAGIKLDTKITFAGIVDTLNSRISKAGKKFYIANVSDTKGSIDILFSERNMNTGRTKEYLESGKPVAIYCDVKCSPERTSLFGSTVEELSLNTQLNGTLHITIKDENAVPALKKTLEAIGPGYTHIEFNLTIGNKRVLIPLNDKYNITTENLELFKTINNIEFTF